MRLGIFLVVTTVLVIATLIYLVGASLLEVRDPYVVVLQGGSAGLEVGSQVRFNDIVVGRVEHVRLDPEDPGQVIINLSLEHGTPVTEDTIAIPEMANITGTKMLSMHGGTKDSKRLNPGDTIQSSTSDLSMITTKVVNIADKLEDLLANLVAVTNTTNMDKVSSVISEVEGITKNINGLIDENRENISGLVTDARTVIADAKTTVAKANQSLDKIDAVLSDTDHAINGIATTHNLKTVTTILDSVNGVMNNVTTRTSDNELGETIQSVNHLVADTNVTVLRLRSDLQRVMKELETSIENINEFTQILVENPSVLISGRTEKERQLK